MSKTERCLVAAALATIFALVAIFILIDMASPELRLSRLSARTLEIVDVEPAGEPEPPPAEERSPLEPEAATGEQQAPPEPAPPESDRNETVRRVLEALGSELSGDESAEFVARINEAAKIRDAEMAALDGSDVDGRGISGADFITRFDAISAAFDEQFDIVARSFLGDEWTGVAEWRRSLQKGK